MTDKTMNSLVSLSFYLGINQMKPFTSIRSPFAHLSILGQPHSISWHSILFAFEWIRSHIMDSSIKNNILFMFADKKEIDFFYCTTKKILLNRTRSLSPRLSEIGPRKWRTEDGKKGQWVITAMRWAVSRVGQCKIHGGGWCSRDRFLVCV